jgi:deoxyribodipyrimidine photo-lyase
MSESPLALVWFRKDLRLRDNPALWHALDRGFRVLPVFIWSAEEEGEWPLGGASRWWLGRSLAALDGDLRTLASRLIVRQGAALPSIEALVRESGATAIFWNRRYEPAIIERDKAVKSACEGWIEAKSFNGSLLIEPWDIKTQQGRPYQVYSPLWRAFEKLDAPPRPRPAPAHIPGPTKWPDSVSIGALDLEPRLDWAKGFEPVFSPGEQGAQRAKTRFLDSVALRYRTAREYPSEEGTSRLSPHLHFGEVSPRELWHQVQAKIDAAAGAEASQAAWYQRELVWREFAHHLIYHFPHTPTQPLRENFRAFPWATDPQGLEAWKRGRTGYPIVDAGMRELWATGWMHNRVRMIVSSFLVKDLRISWVEGARWFWDTLVDADLANNTLGWQWSGGCGADAAPYFRIFNPISQGEKFDAEGAYVRRWVPELAALPNSAIHRPWELSELQLRACGVVLGKDYPPPIVDHAKARVLALEAFSKVKSYTGMGER